jgi:hypothetical protein
MKLALLTLSFLSLCVSAQDYTSYNQLLAKYAKTNGVDYKTLVTNKSDKQSLDQLVKDWSVIDSAKLRTKERAAFRINLYNAAMLTVVLDKYPLKSVTNIGIPFSVFKRSFITTPTGKISLDTLEKKQLLKDFPDPRVHFAVNCASVSCPPLRNEAFTGVKLEQQLNEQAKQFVSSKHAVRVKGNTAEYSSLFDWHKKDFGSSNPAEIINKYSDTKISTKLQVKWIKYDWSLNESH